MHHVRHLSAGFVAVLVFLGNLYSWGVCVAAQPPHLMGMGWEPSSRLGVTVRGLTFETLASLNLNYGVQVTAVFPHSPAKAAGVKREDIILELDRSPVYSVERLHWLLSRSSAEAELAVKYFRRGEMKTAVVALKVPEAASRPPPFWGMWPWPTATHMGVRLQTMTDELREVFGAPQGVGVLIVKVSDDSPAARAGLAVGDVILKMGSKRIRGIPDVYRVLDFFDPGEKVKVAIVRDRQASMLVVALEKGPAVEESYRRQHEWWYAPYGLPLMLNPNYWQETLQDVLEKWEHLWRELSEYPDDRKWGDL